MDPFAQSRADDDLFADDFEPVTEPAIVIEDTPALPESEPTPVVQSSNYSSGSRDVRLETRAEGANGRGGFAPKQQDRRPDQRQRGGRGGRGGPNQRGGSSQHGMGQSKYADQPEPSPAAVPAPTQTLDPSPHVESSNVENTPEPTSHTPVNVAPTPEVGGRVPAVRGDRSATGGPAHKKPTEEEMTAKMEKMAIFSAKKNERHQRSQADQAAFQHREKELAKETREKAIAESKNSRAMETERAKNRERKMKAQGGREWDSEKTDADIVDKRGRTSEFVRGGFGGVARGGLGNSKYATQNDEESNGQTSRGGGFEIRGRGRGGARGARGGGRGGRSQGQAVPLPEEFPPLSSGTVTSPKPGGDWAEEMATPVEEKKIDIGEPKEA